MYNDISSALSGYLNTMADKPPISFENGNYTPIEGVLYLSEYTMFETKQNLTLVGKIGRIDLTYQVNIHAPIESGKHLAQREADKVINHFNAVDRITRNGNKVEVHTATAKGAFTDGGWYVIPVLIDCVAFG